MHLAANEGPHNVAKEHDALVLGKYKLVYLTPEKLSKNARASAAPSLPHTHITVSQT